MSDKQCRGSSVSIIENTDARVVIRWRHALYDVRYNLPNEDPATRWGDWTDETHTIYPDGVSVRRLKMWGTNPLKPHDVQEATIFNNPGTAPEDNIDLNAVTLANLRGETQTYSWEGGVGGPFERPNNAIIELVNIKSAYKPFVIVPPKGARLTQYSDRSPWSHFPCYDHFPTAQIPSDGRRATASDKATSSCLSNWVWDYYETDDRSATKIMMTGLTDKPAAELVPLAESWTKPPKLKALSDGYKGGKYDPAQRAYVITQKTPGMVAFDLAAGENSPVVNPCFVVRNWGDSDVKVALDGNLLPLGKDLRVGHVPALEGTDLIVWARYGSTATVHVEITPGTPPKVITRVVAVPSRPLHPKRVKVKVKKPKRPKPQRVIIRVKRYRPTRVKIHKPKKPKRPKKIRFPR
jgi:hypothetical protein